MVSLKLTSDATRTVAAYRVGMNLLTPREREIAALVARGKNNRAIAGDLCVSLRTVENHLYSIFSKLAVANRTELALAVYRSATLLQAV